MSRESDAKARQCYQPHPKRDRCGDCKYVVVGDISTPKVMRLRRECRLGGFVVLVGALCDLFENGGES